jgi:hypothetical protein
MHPINLLTQCRVELCPVFDVRALAIVRALHMKCIREPTNLFKAITDHHPQSSEELASYGNDKVKSQNELEEWYLFVLLKSSHGTASQGCCNGRLSHHFRFWLLGASCPQRRVFLQAIKYIFYVLHPMVRPSASSSWIKI